MNTPDEMWQALLEGRDAITDLPEGRWSEFLDEPRLAERIAKARTRGGYLTDIKGFDAEFFALSKMEADNIDPQQRMALELTWEALEYARIPASSLRGESVGVFVGSSTNDYSYPGDDRIRAPRIPYAITGTASSIIANRVSYFYDFRGPSMAIDTACSSSLVAVHQGVQALRAGEADVVVAGGVNALVTPLVTLGFDEVGGVLAAGRPDQVVLLRRRRLRPLRGRRHAGAQAPRRRPPRRRRDPRRDRRQRGQPRRPVQRPARPEPRRPGRRAAQGLQGRRHRPAHRRLHRGARHRHHPRRPDRGRRAGPGGRPGPRRRQARAARCGEVQRGTPGVGGRRGQPGQGRTVAAATTSCRRRSTTPDPTPTSTSTGCTSRSPTPSPTGRATAATPSPACPGFGFGGANAHLVLREVLPADLVEPEPEPEVRRGRQPAKPTPTPSTSAACGWTSTASSSTTTTTTTSRRARPARLRRRRAEPELPGLTDEALRLLEVAREELRRRRAAGTRCAAGGFGIPDLPQAGHRRRARRLDRQPGGPGVVAGVDRPVAVAAQPRPLPRGGAGPRPRRGRQGPARDRRRQAEPAGATAPTARSPTARSGCWPVSVRSTARWARACICATRSSPSGSTRSTR